MKEILGVSEKSGVYEGRDYHNLYLHTAEPFGSPEYGYGQRVEFHKVKFSNASSLVEASKGTLSNLIGRYVELNYNKYGNLTNVVIVK